MINNKLAIIVPCYNEEDIIEDTIQKLNLFLEDLIFDGLISPHSKICFVNDGSEDDTIEIIQEYCKSNKKISLIKLTKNYGQQNATLAGLETIDADIFVTIDADLQDDYLVIKDMIEKYFEGYDIVYGVRKKRDTDTFFKKTTAVMFYNLMNIIGIHIRQNHSEFRLMSKNAIEKLKAYREKTIFLRGLVQNIGLKSTEVYYDRLKRQGGNTKYSAFKLFELAWTAITSLSLLPLRLITFLGAVTSFISLLIFFYGIISYFNHKTTPGWTSIIMTIAFFSGIIIMSLGIIGEYLGEVLIEVKDRPLYQIDKTINL